MIKEGEREVGRYEERDGQNKIEVIQHEAPKPQPVVSEEEEGGEEEDAPPAAEKVSLQRQWEILKGVAAKERASIAALNRLPWMIELRRLDERYHLEDRLGRYRNLFLTLIIILLVVGVLYRVVKILLWVFKTPPSAPPPPSDPPPAGG